MTEHNKKRYKHIDSWIGKDDINSKTVIERMNYLSSMNDIDSEEINELAKNYKGRHWGYDEMLGVTS